MNLYEFNQMAMSDKQNFPIWGKEKIKKFITENILPTIAKTKKQDVSYWLLYNKERSDVSFIIDNDKFPTSANKTNDLYETLFNRGRIINMNTTSDGQSAYEIWIKDKDTEDVHMYLLFEYSQGVINI